MARLLVVDDNEDMCKSLEIVLTRAGHQVFCAFNGAEALQKHSEVSPDLVLTDIRLPDMYGPQAASQMLLKDPKLKVITMSGHPGPGRYRVDLRKPFDTKDMLAAIDAALS